AGGVAVGSAKVGTAKVDFNMGGLPREPKGTATVIADGVAAGATKIGRVNLNARGDGHAVDMKVAAGGPGTPFAGAVSGRVTLGARATRVEFGAIDAPARGLEARGKGGSLSLAKNGAITAEKIRLASSAGTVTLNGNIEQPRPGAGGSRSYAAHGQLHV